MANNYYDATGVLVLDKVTPVITALFGAFNLDKDYPGNGFAYIARISEGRDPMWDDIRDGLIELAEGLGLTLPEDTEDGIDEYLYLLSTHFCADHDEVLANLIEHHSFEDGAELDALFEIAVRFSDGHGLKAIKIEGSWHCDKPRLHEFGGDGAFIGRHVYVSSSSGTAPDLGESLEAALESGNIGAGAERILSEVNGILAGVTNEGHRSAMRQTLSALLA